MTVRQAKAEGPEGAGLVGGEQTGILRMFMVVNGRNLSDTAGHCHRQFAGRIDLAGEDFRDSLSSHLARLPNIQDSVHILFGPSETVGSACHQHQYGRFASRGHSLK